MTRSGRLLVLVLMLACMLAGAAVALAGARSACDVFNLPQERARPAAPMWRAT